MATGALGHTHVRLHFVSIQIPNKAQVSTRATSIIIHTTYIHTHTHTHTHTHIYIYIYIKEKHIHIYIDTVTSII